MARENCVALGQHGVETNQGEETLKRESLATSADFYGFLLDSMLSGGTVIVVLCGWFGLPLFWVGSVVGGVLYLAMGLFTQNVWYGKEKVKGYKRVGIAISWPFSWLYDLFFSKY